MSTARYLTGTLVLYTVLCAAMTWPQFRHLTDTVHDDGDPLLNAWALAWVAHELPRAPAHVFDGNIFYPERRTLAYSETLLLPAAIVAPLAWAGVGTLLIYNLVFLSGFIVSGAGTALLVRSLTGSGAAGILAGIVFAFLPYRIDHFPHLQLQQTQCLPFALWAFHRLLASNRIRDGALFGAFTAGQILSCMYYGLFLVPYLAVVCGVMLAMDAANLRRRLPALAVAAAIIVVAVIPVGLVHLGARTVVGERSAEEVETGSATLRNYLGPPEANLVYGRALKRFADGERRLFPGFVAMALAIVGLFAARPARLRSGPTLSSSKGRLKPSRSTDPWSACLGNGWSGKASAERAPWAYAIGLLLAVDLSLGFNGFTYRLLYEYVLPFRGLRNPARMGIIAEFSLAVLAGYGAHRVIGNRRYTLAIVLAIAMLIEYASKPLDLQKIPDPPASYADILADIGDGPAATLFEFPTSALDDPTYMYYSTFHWQRLVNGYSGFFPPSYVRIVRAMANFPDQASIDAIKSRGARYLVVHGERLFGARYEELIPELERRRDLTLLSRRPSFGPDGHKEVRVYKISYADAP